MNIKKWVAGTGAALVMLLVLVVPVMASSYTGAAIVTVVESAGNSYAALPMSFTVNNSYMATNGFMQSDGLDALVQTTGGTMLPTMIDSTQTLFVAPVTKNMSNGFNFTTGNTPVASMPIIVGTGGYITVPDNAALEPANTFSIVANGYFDTTAGAGKNIINKAGAMQAYVDPVTSGTIDALVPNAANLISPGSLSPSVTAVAWTNPANAYDGNTATAARYPDLSGTLSSEFTITNSATLCDQVVFTVGTDVYSGDTIDVDVYYSGSWHTVYNGGSLNQGVYPGTPNTIVANLPTYPTKQSVTGVRFQFTGSGFSDAYHMYEIYYASNPFVQVSGISSGVHTLTLSEAAAAGGTLSLQVDSGTPSTSAGAGSVPDTANNWILDQNNVMPYITSYTEITNSLQALWYQPNTIVSGTTLVDRFGTQNGTITFGSNAAGITITIGPLSVVGAGSSSVGSSPSGGSVNYAPASSGNQTNAETPPALNAVTFPLEPAVHAIAVIFTASSPMSEPATELMIIRILAGLTIVGGAIGSLFLIRGHLFIAGIAGTVLMGIWIAWHVYPLAAISITVVFLIGTILADRGGSD
jgi:hypothetical protein